MTTTELTTVNVANAVFDALTQTLVSMSESDVSVQSLSDLADAFTTAKNYKGHSRAVTLDERTAAALRSVIAQSDINETRSKTVTDKLDAAFPASATAVQDRPEEDENTEDHPETTEPQTTEPQTAPATVAEPERPVVAPNAPTEQPREQQPVPSNVPPAQNVPVGEPNVEGVFNPDLGRTPVSIVHVSPERVVPNISATALVQKIENLPDLATFEVQHGKGGIVRYRSRARKSGGFVAVVDVKNDNAPDFGITLPDDATALVICENHGMAAPLPRVRPGKYYLRTPERFCALCAVQGPPAKPEPSEPKPRGRRPKAEQPAPPMRETVKVVEQSEPVENAVIHPSDERAGEADWNNFSSDLATKENATVVWNADRQYAIIYSEGKGIDVYVSAQGIENRWRIGTTNYNSLEEAKEALSK